MEHNKESKPFSWINFVDILDSSKIGLWSIEIDNNTGINRMYCNDTMLSLLGMSSYFSTEKCFEFWYSRIHKGYYYYVEKAIEKICKTNQSIEIQYPWNHPKLGNINVRCSGKLISMDNGIVTIKGYHQNINDLNQMQVVLSKMDNEIFEWHQDSKIAYIHTNYSQLFKDESNIENFPQSWIDNGNVHEFFKDIYLSAFNRINNGSKKSICELKLKNKEGNYTWFKMTLSKEDIPSDLSNIVIGTFENINRLKEMEITYVIESKFYKTMLKETEAYGEANITNNKFLYTGGLWNSYNNVIDKLTISEILEKNIFKVIHQDDRSKYSKILNYKHLLNLYNKGDNIVKCEFRRIVDKKTIKWMELTISLFQEPYKKDILGLLYLRDIDSNKKLEIALKYDEKTEDLIDFFPNHIKYKNLTYLGENLPFDNSAVLIDNIQSYKLNKKIIKIILETISHIIEVDKYEDKIYFILKLLCSFYKSEFGFVFEINKDETISSYSLLNNALSNEIKVCIEKIITNELIPSPINQIKYLSVEKDAISISYNLYEYMIKYNLSNMIIIPIINNYNHLGYTICINNNIKYYSLYDNLEEYSKYISYFINQEVIKNNLKNELNLEKNYDSLTGLLNRKAYRKYEKYYDADNIKNIGILCLALNELNNINHTAGILAGDNILSNLAEILKTQFYKNPIFRLNGNEFLVIIENIKYNLFIKEIEILSKSLEKVGLSMTYGKVWSSEEKELNHLVNSAIYFRKAESQKNKQLINNNTIYKRNTLLTELMMSIESKEYEIFLQPKIFLKDNKLSGAEALIRKKNSEGNYIPPDKFIPILEHHYLIQYIDLFVFEEVFKLLQNWKNQNRKLIPISLNFSRRTLLEDDIVKMVLDIKNKYDIDPSYIEIEITENIGSLEKQSICTALKEIENMGISILLDDFGVKYSNLTILSEIDFDGLKLDKTMVKNLGYNTTNEIIMKNIIYMCKDLNIKTIAEGVERIEQENILRDISCDMVQGYLYSKPLSVKDFLKKYCI